MLDGPGAPDNQEIAKVQAPIVDIKKADETSQAEDPPIIKPKNESESTVDLDNDLGVIEHVDKAKREALVREIGEFYNVPQSAIEKGLETEIFIVNKERFNKEFESYMIKQVLDARRLSSEAASSGQTDPTKICDALGISNKMLNIAVNADTSNLSTVFSEAADNAGGVLMNGNPPKIIVTESDFLSIEDLLDHELFHAMGMNKGDKFTGFRSNGITDRDSKYTDEVAVEVLRLHKKYPEQGVGGLVQKLASNEIKSPYTTQTVAMLMSMLLTMGSDKPPFMFNDLAKYYFRENGHNGESLMASDILSKVEGGNLDMVRNFMMSDFSMNAVTREFDKLKGVDRKQ